MFIYANAFFWIIFLNTKIDANDAKKFRKYIRVILRRITFSFRISVSERNTHNHATYFKVTRLHNSNLVYFSLKKPKNRYFWKKNDKKCNSFQKKIGQHFPLHMMIFNDRQKETPQKCVYFHFLSIHMSKFFKIHTTILFKNKNMFFLDFFLTIETFERHLRGIWEAFERHLIEERSIFLPIVCYPH